VQIGEEIAGVFLPVVVAPVGVANGFRAAERGNMKVSYAFILYVGRERIFRKTGFAAERQLAHIHQHVDACVTQSFEDTHDRMSFVADRKEFHLSTIHSLF